MTENNRDQQKMRELLEVDTSASKNNTTKWLRLLQELGLLWHMDDDHDDCLSDTGLTQKELRRIGEQHNGAWEASDQFNFDIHEIALAALNGEL